MEKTLINFADGKSESYPSIDFTDQYERLKTLLKVQKWIIRKDMHKAMSPLSAISGYLELMKIVLQNDADTEIIERYRTKIDEGINKLGDIIENLHEVFKEDSEIEELGSDKSIVDLEIYYLAN